jgi:hypothetical protein
MKEIRTVKILGTHSLSIPLIIRGKEVVEASRMTENTPRADLTITFHKIQRPLLDTESPSKPRLYPPPIASFFIKGIERVTRKRKGRMTRTSLIKCLRGSLAKRAIAIKANAKRPKRRNELGGELTPMRIKVKKTMILTLASNS